VQGDLRDCTEIVRIDFKSEADLSLMGPRFDRMGCRDSQTKHLRYQLTVGTFVLLFPIERKFHALSL